jgi:hypothetical protein
MLNIISTMTLGAGWRIHNHLKLSSAWELLTTLGVLSNYENVMLIVSNDGK